MRCDDAATTLTDLADGAEVPDTDARAHIERCLRCQAELAQHRKLRRAMAQLRVQHLEPGTDLVADVLATVAGVDVDAEPTHRSANRHRAAYVAAATAATAAGAVLLASRSRRTRLSPTG